MADRSEQSGFWSPTVDPGQAFEQMQIVMQQSYARSIALGGTPLASMIAAHSEAYPWVLYWQGLMQMKTAPAHLKAIQYLGGVMEKVIALLKPQSLRRWRTGGWFGHVDSIAMNVNDDLGVLHEQVLMHPYGGDPLAANEIKPNVVPRVTGL